MGCRDAKFVDLPREVAINDALGLVRRFVAQLYPSAEAALLSGSQARGEATISSDYDVVLLFPSLPEGAWRAMVLFEDRHVECFAHDIATLAYFCREVDRRSGVPALPAMVVEGVSALPRPSLLLDAARGLARETLRLGPRPLEADSLRSRGFAITDLAVALRGAHGTSPIAAGAALYTALADFALRAAGKWSATGKVVPRALAAADATLAARFAEAFDALFAAGDTEPVQKLVDVVLAPYGGRLREGFRQGAPVTWRDPPGPSPRE